MTDENLLSSTFGERKKEQNNNLLNKLLNKLYIVKSFSVPKSFFPDLVKFMEISNREDGNFSLTVCKAIREYAKRHRIPNPQARLDRLLEIELPHKPAWQCCVPNCKNKARFQLILKDFHGKTEVFRVCWAHQKWKHKRFRFLAGFKDLRDVL
jgi:hypothetical protein